MFFIKANPYAAPSLEQKLGRVCFLMSERVNVIAQAWRTSTAKNKNWETM